MITKTEILKTAMLKQDWEQAIKIASKFPNLGEHKNEIKTAKDAMFVPSFYEQIGKNPKDLIAIGVDAIKVRYAYLLIDKKVNEK